MLAKKTNVLFFGSLREVFAYAKVKLLVLLAVKYGLLVQVKLSLPTSPKAKLHCP